MFKTALPITKSSDPISRWNSNPAANESSGSPSHIGLDGDAVGDAGAAVGAKDATLGLGVSPTSDGDRVGAADGSVVAGDAVGAVVAGDVDGATVGSVVGGLVAGDVVGAAVGQLCSRS